MSVLSISQTRPKIEHTAAGFHSYRNWCHSQVPTGKCFDFLVSVFIIFFLVISAKVLGFILAKIIVFQQVHTLVLAVLISSVYESRPIGITSLCVHLSIHLSICLHPSVHLSIPPSVNLNVLSCDP